MIHCSLYQSTKKGEPMEKYVFSTLNRSVLEKLKQPFAVYQFVDKRVVTLLLSDGFLELFGYDKRGHASR